MLESSPSLSLFHSHSLPPPSLNQECAHTAQQTTKTTEKSLGCVHTHHTDAGGTRGTGYTCTRVCGMCMYMHGCTILSWQAQVTVHTFMYMHMDIHKISIFQCLRKGYRLMSVVWSMMSLLYAWYAHAVCQMFLHACTLTLVKFLASSNCLPGSSGLIVPVSYLHVHTCTYMYGHVKHHNNCLVSLPSKIFLQKQQPPTSWKRRK